MISFSTVKEFDEMIFSNISLSNIEIVLSKYYEMLANFGWSIISYEELYLKHIDDEWIQLHNQKNN